MVAGDKPRGHGQQANPALMHCPACRIGNCIECPDRIFLILGKKPACTCKKSGHEEAINGEARQYQVKDPFTEEIHGPGIRITQEGVVERTTSAD